jgi:hypothetical protein
VSYFKNSVWDVLGLKRKVRPRRLQEYLQQAKQRSRSQSTSVSRQQMCQNGHIATRENTGIGGAMREWAGRQIIKCKMCPEHDKDGNSCRSEEKYAPVKRARWLHMCTCTAGG